MKWIISSKNKIHLLISRISGHRLEKASRSWIRKLPASPRNISLNLVLGWIFGKRKKVWGGPQSHPNVPNVMLERMSTKIQVEKTITKESISQNHRELWNTINTGNTNISEYLTVNKIIKKDNKFINS